jgi:aspartate racemase
MRRLGIIGGVSWHSTLAYYASLNSGVEKATKGRNCVSLVLSSMNLGEILRGQKKKSHEALLDLFVQEGRRLKSAGCDAFLIASHTYSMLGSAIEKELDFQHISLFSAVERHLIQSNVNRMGLIGSLHTMTDDSFAELYECSGLTVVRPEEPHLNRVAGIVFRELIRGLFRTESRHRVRDCLNHLGSRGVDAIVLGCTELGLLIPEREWVVPCGAGERKIPLIDLIEVHVEQAIRWMFEPNQDSHTE